MGVRIVESVGRAWVAGEPWTVEATPILDLSTSGDGVSHQFFRVVDATRLPDGEIWVAQADEVRLFSSQGQHLRTLGRRGDGPGEFRFIGRVELIAPDTLLVFDRGLRRATLFGPKWEVVHTVPIDVYPIRPDRFEVLGGRFVVVEPRSMRQEEEPRLGLHRLPATVLSVSRSGVALDTLAIVLGEEFNLRRMADDVLAYADVFFGRDAHLAVHGRQVMVGDGRELGFRVLNEEGEVEQIVRAAYDVTLTPEMVEAETSACLLDARTREDSSFVYSLPVPETRAAYRDLKVDPTGAVWLEEQRGNCVYMTTPSAQRWEVFGSDGVWLGQVSLPARFEVFEIGRSYILGVFRDQLDVERVQVLALRRVSPT
jgi:hypothetical protein